MALIRVSWRLLESTESSGWAQGKHSIDVLFSSPCAGLYATSAIPQCSQARPGPTEHTLSRPRSNPGPQGHPQPHAVPASSLSPQLIPSLGMCQGSTEGGWCLLRVARNCPAPLGTSSAQWLLPRCSHRAAGSRQLFVSSPLDKKKKKKKKRSPRGAVL